MIVGVLAVAGVLVLLVIVGVLVLVIAGDGKPRVF